MFIFQLMGGLGNQMFQYATAKALSVKRNIPFAVTFDDPYQFAKREYALDCFNMPVIFANPKLLRSSAPATGVRRGIMKILRLNADKRLFQEKQYYHFDESIFTAADETYFRGFWQSYLYFTDIRKNLLNDFSFKYKLDAGKQKLLNSIVTSQSVSLHIRRGDYVEVQRTNTIHGTCDLTYYDKAVEAVRSQVQSPKYFVFSDDIAWVKQNLSIDGDVVFVSDTNSVNAYDDMRLMAACRHNIIANSSYSWWGAWLGNQEEKVVVCPAYWTSTHKTTEIDLIPKNWIIV